MRTLFLLLLLANLLVFAGQFPVVRSAIFSDDTASRAGQLNAERLRIVRDTSVRTIAPAAAP